MKRPCIKSSPIVVYNPIMHKFVWWFLHNIRSHKSPRTDEKCAYNLSLPLASSDVSNSMASDVLEKMVCRNCHTSVTAGWQNKPAHSASADVLASATGGIVTIHVCDFPSLYPQLKQTRMRRTCHVLLRNEDDIRDFSPKRQADPSTKRSLVSSHMK